MNLSRHEQETVILFNEEEPNARIETFNGRIIRETEKAAKNCAEIVCEERKNGYGVYRVPKKLIKIHAPRVLSETQLKKLEMMREKAKGEREKDC